MLNYHHLAQHLLGLHFVIRNHANHVMGIILFNLHSNHFSYALWVIPILDIVILDKETVTQSGKDLVYSPIANMWWNPNSYPHNLFVEAEL